MSLVIAAPESMATAATDLANIGSTISAAHMAASTPTVAVIPAAADEVSSGIADVFSQHARDYQALAGQAAAFHEQFVQHLTSSAGSYAGAEAANAALLQPLTAAAASVAAVQDQLVSGLEDVLVLAAAAIVLPILAIVLIPFLAVIAAGVVLALALFGATAILVGLGVLAQSIVGML